MWQVCYHSSLALLRFGFFFFRLAAQHAVGSACRRPYETILRNAFAVFCLRKFPLRTGQPSCYVDSAFRYLSNRDVPGARSSRFTFSLWTSHDRTNARGQGHPGCPEGQSQVSPSNTIQTSSESSPSTSPKTPSRKSPSPICLNCFRQPAPRPGGTALCPCSPALSPICSKEGSHGPVPYGQR